MPGVETHSGVVCFIIRWFEAALVLYFVEIGEIFLEATILAVVDSHMIFGEHEEGLVRDAKFSSECWQDLVVALSDFGYF